MNQERSELLMKVEGMSCQGCVDAVTKAVRRLDGGAQVEVDLAHGRARIFATAQALEVAEALNKAGFEASAMTL